MKSFFIFIKELAEIIIIALLAVFLIRNFLMQPFFVKGASMSPNFESGDYLIIDELTYRLRPPERGEVIVFKFPLDPSNYYIKRIIGLPKETIEIKNGNIIIFNSLHPEGFILQEPYLSDKKITSPNLKFNLSENEFFVMGDNRKFSYDSRSWGPLNKDLIIGLVRIRAWPIKSANVFTKAPAY